MSEWFWVTFGYGVAYLSLAGYLTILVRRWVRARRGAEGRQ